MRKSHIVILEKLWDEEDCWDYNDFIEYRCYNILEMSIMVHSINIWLCPNAMDLEVGQTVKFAHDGSNTILKVVD